MGWHSCDGLKSVLPNLTYITVFSQCHSLHQLAMERLSSWPHLLQAELQEELAALINVHYLKNSPKLVQRPAPGIQVAQV